MWKQHAGGPGSFLKVNDCEQGSRIGTVSWYDESGQGWSSPGVFGTALLGGSAVAADGGNDF